MPASQPNHSEPFAHWSRRSLLAASGAVAVAGLAHAGLAAAQDASPVPADGTPQPLQPSEEATEGQLKIARSEGRAYGKALDEITGMATSFQTVQVRDFEITVIAEKAEGFWVPAAGELQWTEPGEENAHIEVAVRDASDGRFIPGLNVSVTLTPPEGDTLNPKMLPFVWHPFLFHYGRNFTVPADGDYGVHVRIDPPAFYRHDQTNGNRYAGPVDFDVTLKLERGTK